MAASLCLSFYSKIYLTVSIYKVYLFFTVITFSRNEDASTKEAEAKASEGVYETLLCADAGESQRFHTSHLN